VSLDAHGLVRTIGRWTLAGLILQAIIGSGVYGLPSLVAAKVGSLAWVAVLAAAVAIGTIVACFAEVASRFPGTGGPYLYTTMAFGPLAGIQIGWLHYLTRLTATATNANLFVIYLGEFVPGIGGWTSKAVIVALIGGLALVNYLGVRQATWLSNVFVVAKIVPLVLFGLVGLTLVAARGAVTAEPSAVPTIATWADALVFLMFAYGGFESGIITLGEAKNPARDAPFALFVALALCAVLYTSVQAVTSLTLADPAVHQRPVADAARALIGPAGAAFMALGALTSLFGWCVGALVAGPRLTFAMGEQGALPRAFARVHPRFRTPSFSIVAYAVLAVGLALSAGFVANLTLSVMARLGIYGLVCLSLPVLRRRERADSTVPPARFRLPAGTGFAVAGLVLTAALASRITAREASILAVVATLATANWWLSRPRVRAAAASAAER